MLQADTFKFLKDLKKNNNREWFVENKHRYESAKQNVVTLVTDVLALASKEIPELKELKAEKCIMRIYRDVRFSKNKDPYKLNFGIYFPTKAKGIEAPGYYLHIQPGQCFVAGGFWMPPADALKNIRQEIDYNSEEFLGIIGNKNFKKYFVGLSDEDKLSTAPKGYPKDHPQIELLKLKSFTVSYGLDDSALSDKKIVKEIVGCLLAMQPLVNFLQRATDLE